MTKLVPNWRWMRIYYYDRSKDRLLLDAIRPAILSVQHQFPDYRYYFQRDWHRGPNILIGSSLETGEHAAKDIVTRAINSYLKSHPSIENLSDAEYLRVTKGVSHWEAKTDYSHLPCRPNNMIFGEEPEPQHHFLVQPELKQACWTFLASTTPYVLTWLNLSREGYLYRDTIAMTLMIMIVWLADPHLLRPYTSFVSHATGFLNSADTNTSIRTAFEVIYNGSQGGSVRSLIRETVHRLEHPMPETLPGEHSFKDLLAQTLHSIFQGLRSQELQPVDASAFFSGQVITPKNSGMIKTMNECYEWRAWQITISLFYQVLNQLGISAAERFLACYLLGRGIEDVYEHDHERIIETINTQPSAVFTFSR